MTKHYDNSSAFFTRSDTDGYRLVDDAALINAARAALDRKIQRQGSVASSEDSKALMSLRLGATPHEVFVVAFLDAQHRIIEIRDMFRGTLTQTSVYPREIVKEALQLNAAAVLLSHQHPSGVAEPSRADEQLTRHLKAALAMVDIRVLDHLVVGAGTVVSFAERGLL